ncbi:MAG: YbhB/YbcL family Raf kinase inhibitor-like protein [Candidatus Dadabacteria bacterium]|nr:MAG: YbhB/YbcL family Raf kinase inhibitor-like protein [Candidatus Dadabacteria bacterium]
MKLRSDSFEHGGPIPSRCAFGKYHPETHVELSENRNPHLEWSDVPQGTRSFAIICHDSDVPSKPDDVNQEGKTIPADLPRVEFTHWVLIDLPADRRSVAEGEFSNGITPKGKPGPQTDGPARQGINDYTAWFASDPEMAGDYYGYDGPCPPWNDERIHHYHFTVYALDVDRLPVEGKFGRTEVLEAMKGHVLAEATITGTYHINPEAR